MGGLTNPGLITDQGQGTDPTTGMPVQLPPIVKFFKNAALRGHQAALDEMSTVQPGRSNISGPDGAPAQLPQPNPVGMSQQAAGGPMMVDPQTYQSDTNQVSQSQPTSSMPKMFKPSFAQTTQDQNGMPTQINPAETKLGKLVHILGAAAQGALAGWGQGNPGAGAQAAREIPYQEATQRGNLAQQQAQLALTRAQSTMVQTPLGPMTPAMAKAVYPALIGQQGKVQVQSMKGNTAEDIQGQKSETAMGVVGAETKSREKVAQINQGTAIPLDPQVAEMAGMSELAGVPVGRGTLTNINKAIEAKGYRVQDMGMNGTDSNSGMWLMDRMGNRIKQVSPNSLTFQRGASFAQNKTEVVTDPNDPGYAYYTTAAQAMSGNLPAPGSAGNVAAKREAVSEVPTKIGDQKVAFTTAIQHAGLLRQAAKALNNGDQQTLAGLKNAWKNEFGQSGPITSQAIADAYSDEVTKILASGHLTDKSMGKTAKTLDPTKQNYQTIDSVLGAYQGLAQSKLNMLNQQAQAARTQGRHPAPNQPPAAMSGEGQPSHDVFAPDGTTLIGHVVNNKYVPVQ